MIFYLFSLPYFDVPFLLFVSIKSVNKAIELLFSVYQLFYHTLTNTSTKILLQILQL